MVVQGRIGEAGGCGQNEHAAGKADVVFAVKGVERLTRPVEDAAAPPGGGVRVRPGADEPVRLAGLAVGQQIGRLAGRGLVHDLVAAEDGVPAEGVIAGEEPQPAVPQGGGVVFRRFLLLLGMGHGPGWRGQQRTGGEHPRRQCQARRRAADAEKILFHNAVPHRSQGRNADGLSHLIIIRNTRTFHCIGTFGHGYNLVTAKSSVEVCKSR